MHSEPACTRRNINTSVPYINAQSLRVNTSLSWAENARFHIGATCARDSASSALRAVHDSKARAKTMIIVSRNGRAEYVELLRILEDPMVAGELIAQVIFEAISTAFSYKILSKR